MSFQPTSSVSSPSVPMPVNVPSSSGASASLLVVESSSSNPSSVPSSTDNSHFDQVAPLNSNTLNSNPTVVPQAPVPPATSSASVNDISGEMTVRVVPTVLRPTTNGSISPENESVESCSCCRTVGRGLLTAARAVGSVCREAWFMFCSPRRMLVNTWNHKINIDEEATNRPYAARFAAGLIMATGCALLLAASISGFPFTLPVLLTVIYAKVFIAAIGSEYLLLSLACLRGKMVESGRKSFIEYCRKNPETGSRPVYFNVTDESADYRLFNCFYRSSRMNYNSYGNNSDVQAEIDEL